MAHVGLLEDNARIANLCAMMLQYAGHQVTIYEHPRKCLNALLPESTTEDNGQVVTLQTVLPPLPVEVLILDLNLPEINGMDVVRSLCSHPRTRLLPLILCTAASSSDILHVLRIAPHAGFIEKPFTFQELVSGIEQALKSPVK